MYSIWNPSLYNELILELELFPPTLTRERISSSSYFLNSF